MESLEELWVLMKGGGGGGWGGVMSDSLAIKYLPWFHSKWLCFACLLPAPVISCIPIVAWLIKIIIRNEIMVAMLAQTDPRYSQALKRCL